VSVEFLHLPQNEKKGELAYKEQDDYFKRKKMTCSLIDEKAEGARKGESI
jgi:hypothetical protein